MDTAVVGFSAIAPALVLLAYGIAKGRTDWRHRALWLAFVMGAVAATTALAAEQILQRVWNLHEFAPVWRAAMLAVAGAAIPEETVKFIVLVGLAERHETTRRRQESGGRALAVSLGFAGLENLIYVATPQDWQSVALTRALTAVPGHGIDGLAMGALVTLARLSDNHRLGLRWLAWAVPVGIHAAFDFPLFGLLADPAAKWPLLVWPAVAAAGAILAVRLSNWALRIAADADHRSGADRRPVLATSTMAACGWMLLVVSPCLAGALMLLQDLQFKWGGAGLSILPAILGIDLIRTSTRRRRAAARAMATGLIRQPGTTG